MWTWPIGSMIPVISRPPQSWYGTSGTSMYLFLVNLGVEIKGITKMLKCTFSMGNYGLFWIRNIVKKAIIGTLLRPQNKN